MATLTIRIPDDKHLRLRALAKSRGISVNKLMEELSTAGLVEFDAENRFKLLASQGSTRKGLKILDRLDEHFASTSKS